MYSVLTNTWEAGLLGPEESTAVLPSTAPPSAASPNLALACWGSTSPRITIDCSSASSGASWLVWEPPGGLSHTQPTNHPFYLPTCLLSPVGPPEQALEALLSSGSWDQHGFLSHLFYIFKDSKGDQLLWNSSRLFDY